VSVRGFPFAKAPSDSPYLGFVVLVPLDELGWEVQPFSDGDLEGRDAVVVADEVRRDAGMVEVEVGVFPCLQGDVQTVFSVVDARAHRCTVSLPSNFANLDGGHKPGDDFSEGFGGNFVMGSEGGEDGVGRHGSVFVEDDGRGVELGGSPGRRGYARSTDDIYA